MGYFLFQHLVTLIDSVSSDLFCNFFILLLFHFSPLSLFSRVTRWPDFSFNIWPFTTTKLCTIAKMFAKVYWKILQNTKETFSKLPKNLNFLAKVAKFWKNLITLLSSLVSVFPFLTLSFCISSSVLSSFFVHLAFFNFSFRVKNLSDTIACLSFKRVNFTFKFDPFQTRESLAWFIPPPLPILFQLFFRVKHIADRPALTTFKMKMK